MHDYHIHTIFCRHAVGEVNDYVKAAIEKGLKEIGFTAHYPMFHLPKVLLYDDYCMDLEEIPQYIQTVNNAQNLFSKCEVKVGFEADYYKNTETALKGSVDAYEFDYLIGVVHLIDDWIVDDPRNQDRFKDYDLDNLYSKYFGEVESLICSGIFDIVGHIDIIKRFNFIPESGVESYVLPCLDLIVKKDLCVEINTSGLDRPVKDTSPGLHLIKTMYEMGIQVTLGSDAHKPSEVGRHFDLVFKALKEAGYSEIACFDKREKIMKKID